MGMFPIFDKLNGMDEALDAIRQAYGLRPTWPSEHAKKDWLWRRGALPSTLTIRLQQLCEARGVRFKMSDFRVRPERPVKAAKKPAKSSAKARRKRA